MERSFISERASKDVFTGIAAVVNEWRCSLRCILSDHPRPVTVAFRTGRWKWRLRFLTHAGKQATTAVAAVVDRASDGVMMRGSVTVTYNRYLWLDTERLKRANWHS